MIPSICIILLVTWIIAEAAKPSLTKKLALEREEYQFIMDQIANWDDLKWNHWIESRMYNYKEMYRGFLDKSVFESRCKSMNKAYGKRYSELMDSERAVEYTRGLINV